MGEFNKDNYMSMQQTVRVVEKDVEEVEDTMEQQEICDKTYNINSTIALVSTLVLSMTFNIAGTQFSLTGLGICEHEFPECGSCSNVWYSSWSAQSCHTVHSVREIYHCAVYLTAGASLATTLLAVGVIISFQQVPTNYMKEFVHELGFMRSIAQLLMYVVVFFFFVSVSLQASLTMEPGTFSAFCVLFVGLFSVYVVCRVILHVKVQKIIDRIDGDGHVSGELSS